MLFWLGSIEFETPRGRFILTGSSVVRGIRSRLATEEEAADVWRFVEWHLRTASHHELRPLYELYGELTSEPYYGPHGPPDISNVLDAVRFALWSKKLHFEFEQPFDPLPELEWEPPPQVPKGPEAQSPSELWGRKSAKDTFIGVILKDQNGEPITGSRVRIKLPDGTTKEGKTDTDGELCIAGLSVDGNADITFLDHCKPGKAEAPEWPEEKEFKAKVVDEMGNPISGIWLYFRHGNASNLVITDDSGVATYKRSDTDSVSVSFESADDLAQAMKPIWSDSRGMARKDWVQADDATTTVSLFGGNIVKAVADCATTATTRPTETLEPFPGVETTVDNPVTLSVQPLAIVVRMLGELFDTDKCFVLPKALDNVKELVKLHKEYGVCNVLIVGHTDTSGKPDYNLDLSLERANAMSAYVTNDADAWLEWYGDDKKQSKRWGDIEDATMIETLLADSQSADPSSADSPTDAEAGADDTYPHTVLGYQQWHNAKAPHLGEYEELDEDGEIGPVTRKQLILDYMHREDTTVPDGTPILVHGCGEYFPLDQEGQELDPDPDDDQHEQEDRRVEVYLFPRELGVLPAVPAQKAVEGEPEYLEWRYRAAEVDLLTDTSLTEVSLWLLDHAGQRMGADPSSPDPVAQVKGAPYRLVLPSGEVRTGHADAEGRVTEYNFPDNVFCELKWGKSPGGLWHGPSEAEDRDGDQADREDDEDQGTEEFEGTDDVVGGDEDDEENYDDDFFLYSETIFIGKAPPSGDLVEQRLSNLGYEGSLDDRRQKFAADYGSSEDADIHQVHRTGRPRNLA